MREKAIIIEFGFMNSIQKKSQYAKFYRKMEEKNRGNIKITSFQLSEQSFLKVVVCE